VVLESDGNGATLASYILAGTQLISQTRSGVTNYYLQDGQGSVRALADHNGNVTDAYSYTAFGETLSHTGTTVNPYQYTGQQLDTITGLYNLRARYYEPGSGRFLTQDGYPYNLGNPIELNRYAYAANSPLLSS
jgi:RHS repeat-associated protein